MSTISNKIRTIIALSAVGAVLASSAVASATTVVRHPGGVASPVLRAPTVTYLDPGKVGSAGQPGWDNAKCESMAQNLNAAANNLQNDVAKGDLTGVQIDATAVQAFTELINDHCLVID